MADDSPGRCEATRAIVRVRPLSRDESIEGDVESVHIKGSCLTLHDFDGEIPSRPDQAAQATFTFKFDAVLGPDSTQEDVFNAAAQPAVDALLSGYNAAVIAYGPTGSGKTYTMEGREGVLRGVCPRAFEVRADRPGGKTHPR